jgi:thymidylate synthase
MNPTLEEVKKHFKGVKKVKDYTGIIFELKNLGEIESLDGIIWTNSNNRCITLWERINGYSTIIEKISKADQYFIDILNEIKTEGEWDKNPRPKWSDGTPAHSKFITQKSFEYRIDKGESPIISLRPTAIKGGWYDMEAIYQKQTNVVEEMHPSIHPWWLPFSTKIHYPIANETFHTIGQTYGHTVKRYNLMNNLLRKLENDGYSRRHILNLWQEQQMIEDPSALVPCAYETLWSISEHRDSTVFIDLTLNQRSQDFMVTASINPMQYVMLGLAVCGHLTHHTGKEHILRKFKYNVQNLHIYDRHIFAIDELLEREVTSERFDIKLPVNKDFYNYTFEDFIITKPGSKIEPLSQVLEIAV